MFDEKLSGVRVYDKSKVCGGFNLYEGKLMDMKGKVLREWGCKHLGVILPNGDYLGQEKYEGKRWGRYTRDDKVVWERTESTHHEIAVFGKRIRL